jgi:hypothetical protein
VGDIGKKNICIKGKNILPFQKYIFRSDHPVPDDVNLGVKQLFEKVASGIIWTNIHVYYDSKMLYFHWRNSRVNEVMGTVRAI